jgi:hypothetical protein
LWGAKRGKTEECVGVRPVDREGGRKKEEEEAERQDGS